MYWNAIWLGTGRTDDVININMRCIEILLNTYCMCYYYGLTLTWDVLKLIFSCRHIKHPLGLTLTWDVLK